MLFQRNGSKEFNRLEKSVKSMNITDRRVDRMKAVHEDRRESMWYENVTLCSLFDRIYFLQFLSHS